MDDSESDTDTDDETKAGTLNFSSFKTSFTSNVNFLKRRFSSGDLSSECDDVDPNDLPPAARPQQDQTPPLQQQPKPQNAGPPNMPPPPAPSGPAGPAGPTGPVPPQPTTAAPDLALSFGKGPARGVSAPTSPAKSRESLLQRVQSLTGAARDQGASIIGAAVQSATRPTFNKDKYFTLLVLDDQNTDWSKYFRGKRLHGDFDIRVEQAEFREISLTANAENGPVVSMAVYRGGTRVARSFRPDFVLIRQPPRDGASDFRSTILGLKYGGVPSINSLHSCYQFQDKPWVFAHLLQLQRRLGKDMFPLIEQTFFPNPRDLFSWSKFPCVLKAGHCHGGMATARLDNTSALQDAAGLVSGSVTNDAQCYCTIEPYIDAKFDVHIQKIGTNYKAFMRKSISGHWKTNQGSAMLEQIAMTEKYKSWVDEISEMFGGMEVCGVSVVVAKDGREFIISACDCTFSLIGDSQEEDRRQIADLVTSRMQNVCRPAMATKAPPSRSSVSSRGESPTEDLPQAPTGPRPAPMGGPPPIPERSSPAVGSIGRLSSRSSISETPEEAAAAADKSASLASNGRRDSQTSQASNVSNASKVSQRPPQSQTSVVEDAEDTMKNLRKTFAAGKPDVISSQPTKPGPASMNDFSNIAENISSQLAKNTKDSSGGGAPVSSNDTSSDAPSNVLQAFEEENKYKPVTNFEPQERVNPFDKDSKTADTFSASSIYNNTSAIPATTAPVPTAAVTSKSAFSSDIGTKEYLKKYDFESSTASLDSKADSIGGSDYKPPIPTHSPNVASSSSGYTSQSASHTASPSNGYKMADMKSSYSRTESNEKPSDLDIIFGENKSLSGGNGKITRSGGSLSDADIIFGGPPTRSDRFATSKSMSVTTDSRISAAAGDTAGGVAGSNSYKIYEGIQNVAFQDFDSQSIGSTASDHWSKSIEDDGDIDLK